MKIAYVHDWLLVNGGAEKVSASILNVFPDADVFCLIDFLSKKDRADVIKGKATNTSFIQKLPFAKYFYRYYLPYFPKAVEQFNLSEYDIIISSSYSVAKGVLTNSNQLHICYCHSPMRYAWDLYHQYLNGLGVKKILFGTFIKKVLHKIRIWDVISSNRVDFFIANSKNVKGRIDKIYRREADVIYPPVNTDLFKLCWEKDDYYFTASRQVQYKKTEIIIKAFNRMKNKKLIVAGEGPELKKLKKMSADNIHFLGHTGQDLLVEHMQRAKAFVFAAEEDFGIVPIEAQACGTPVIAYGRGGALETVEEGKTGLFFYNQTDDSILEAIEKFEKIGDWDYNDIRQHAMKFNKNIFEKRIEEYIMEKYNRQKQLNNYARV